ncbi:guanine nucleotide-binding protein G(I)/G(S)/G(O) subunit gamma-2 isoform X1 [Sciurus carolinensis]|uniref:guanine nucleotide-binding protein G(I)/G(S)/G(O) subunit gamma-2 isoform X1 n=1 Tax=Sciurus carolinensis TaxID=30640 RepID=UPI001FB55B5B|nr:guanine nucleotide-binding protein G(I)/G(S)/G(O) subunit gamma-2 isoform X1 [Sciurus carolinensis]
MIEDKAGWGLVPGLQPLLLHIHTTLLPPPRSVGNSYYCWAGLGWAGRRGARLHRSAPEKGKPLSSDRASGAKPDLPVSLRL